MRIQILILGFKELSTYLWYWLLQHLSKIQNILVNHVWIIYPPVGKFPDPSYIRQLVFNLKKEITRIGEKKA